MSFRSSWHAGIHHSMRAYYVALIGGIVLIVSAFLPSLYIGEDAFGGVPDIASLWTLGLGALAVLLSSLSIVTRKNSRHPLLLVGLAACGVIFAGYHLMARSFARQAWAREQALEIVEGRQMRADPDTAIGPGVYVGLPAAIMITLFGLTIIFKRVAQPYAPDEDDE